MVRIRRHHKVDSSMIASVGYDPETLTLAVEFQNDHSIWRYSNIQPSTYCMLLNAESIGGYFTEHIKRLPAQKQGGSASAQKPVDSLSHLPPDVRRVIRKARELVLL